MAGRNKKEAPDEPIIGESPFGLTVADVATTLAALQEDYPKILEQLKTADSGMKKYLTVRQRDVEIQMKRLSGSPDEVLDEVRRLYDRTKTLEINGVSEKAMLNELAHDFSDITGIYPLLKKTNWGQELGISVLKIQIRNEYKAS